MNRAEPPIGVATSVAAASGFDPLETLAYAHRHRFPLVQPYLDARVVGDAALRRRVSDRARELGIDLLWHAPGLLRADPATSPALFAAIGGSPDQPASKRVVYHFDETLPVAETLRLVGELHRAGVRACVENYHQLGGPEAGRRHYRNYLELFRQAGEAGLAPVGVIDIPRVFDARLGLSPEEAGRLTAEVLGRLGELGVRVVLHLIDSTNPDMAERRDWCPVGRGVIPYPALLTAVQPEAVVLEYEDPQNPLDSRPFLASVFGAGEAG
jgi:hypothetical protein